MHLVLNCSRDELEEIIEEQKLNDLFDELLNNLEGVNLVAAAHNDDAHVDSFIFNSILLFLCRH